MSDERAQLVLAGFDLACLLVDGPGKNVAADFMADVLGFGWEDWPLEAYRAVLVAFLAAAPSEDIDHAVASAKKFEAWRQLFLLQTEYEHSGLRTCYGDEFQAWASARAEQAAAP